MKTIRFIGITILVIALGLAGYYFYRQYNRKTIVILLYDQFTPLDVVGAYQTFSGLLFKNYELKFVANKRGPVASSHLQSLEATDSYEDISAADILYIPGAEPVDPYLTDEATLNWIRKIDRSSSRTLSTGSGTLLLAAAGLLKGQDCATHWYQKNKLEALGATFVNQNYVRSGKYYTGAGTSAAIDMILALVDDLEGAWQSKATQLFIAYDPEPPVQSGTYDRADSDVRALALRMTSPDKVDTARNRKVIAMMLYEGFTMLDVTGPYQVFRELRPLGYDMVFVSKTKGQVYSDYMLALQTTQSFDEMKTADILFIPGGSRTFAAMHDSTTMQWVTAIDERTSLSTTVCTGSLVLGQAGVLRGRQATSHWYTGPLLKEFGAEYSHGRYTRDGKYITGAGVSSGIDLALMVVKELAGETYAKAIQLKLDYHPAPPYNSGSPEKADADIVEILSKMYEKSIPSSVKGKPQVRSHWDGAVDPVCRMAAIGTPADSLMHEGVLYGFCSKGCKEKFEKHPEQYTTTRR